jgi:hypothetical protein
MRIALDPAVFTYYAPTLVLGGLVCDLLVSRRPFPIWTLVTFGAVVAIPTSVDASVRGNIRLVACAALVLGALLLPAVSDPGRSPLKRSLPGRRAPVTP